MSANCDAEAVERLLSIGAADYFIKPVRTSTLTRLKGLTSRRQQIVKPGQKDIPDSRNSALSISLLQAAQLLSSDSPVNNLGTVLTQQLPPSPPSSTPSPSPQETNFATGVSSNVTHAPSRRVSAAPGADATEPGQGAEVRKSKLSTPPGVKGSSAMQSGSVQPSTCGKVRAAGPHVYLRPRITAVLAANLAQPFRSP